MTPYIERLRSDHDRSTFRCGVEQLNNWLHHLAGQADERRGSARVYVLIGDDDGSGELGPIGFHALTAHQVTFEVAPEEVSRGQSPHLPIGGRAPWATCRR